MSDDRYLWPEMLRVIEELRPRWVVGENVAGIVNMALDTVLSDLESIGYTTQAFITGNIYPCIRYMPNSLGPDIKPLTIGHVGHGLLGTQEEKDCVHCLKCIDRRTQSTDECFNCPIADGCSWCSAYNYQVFGTADRRATYICVMHKARALANAYYWNSLYRSKGLNKRFKIHVPEEWALEIINPDEWKMLKELEEL